MVQHTAEKISELDLNVPRPDAYVPFVQDGVTKRGYLAFAGSVFNVLAFATSSHNAADIVSGAADPSAAFLAAATAAALVGGTVYVPRGTYGTGANWTFALPSGVTIEGDGDASVLLNCYLTATGTAGSEIAFTAPATKGATSISIPATGLSGAWLRLTSCINMQSTDAGRDQLGHDPTAAGFFAEYVRVTTGSAGSATLDGALLWAYSNTPGADSGSFTTSTARQMTFHEGGRVRKLKLLGKNTLQNQNIHATFCRDLLVEDVTIDCNDITSQLIRFSYCLDCHVVGGKLTGKRTGIPASSTANPIVFMSSQGCTAKRTTIRNGNQGLDIDAIPNDATYRGGPSIFCGAVDCVAADQATDGFTSHFACFGSFFENVRVKGAPRGVRIRDRGSSVRGGKLVNGAGTGVGVLVDNAAVIDSVVSEVEVVGYLENVQFSHASVGYATLEGLLGCGTASIQNCKLRDAADHGVYVTTAYTSATLVGPRIVGNDIQNCTDNAIHVQSYNNGTVVERNRISGVPASKAGLRYEANIKRLHIGSNHIYGVNASGFAIQGPGTGSFMTDAATFPAGESEAQLFIDRQFTDAATPYQSVIRNDVAFSSFKQHGYMPALMPVSTSGPTIERQTLGFYLSGSSLRADTRDTSNAFVTHQLNIRGAGTPEGAVTAPVGSTYQRTDGGAGTSFYVKESGSGNTGWVAK